GIRDFHVTGVQTCALPIWALGYVPLDTAVAAVAGGAPIEVLLVPAPIELSGITAAEGPLTAPEPSVELVTPTEIRSVPAALEADLFRAIQALPGVIAPGIPSSRLQ